MTSGRRLLASFAIASSADSEKSVGRRQGRTTPMPKWVSALLFAVLVVTIPYSLIIRILLQLPKPVALSHRRWPMPVNFTLIGAITAYVTLFIHGAYYSRGSNANVVLMEFVIAALAYAFGLVLILRQY